MEILTIEGPCFTSIDRARGAGIAAVGQNAVSLRSSSRLFHPGSSRTPHAHGRGQTLEHLTARFPSQAAIGDALTVTKGLAVDQILASAH